jgi:hypothetical protein
MKLWLDDVRAPWKFGCTGWTWAKTADEAMDYLRTGQVTEASLDHDLTPEQTTGGIYGKIREDGFKSGYDVVVWLAEHPEFWPVNGVRVHSMNISGRKRMQRMIDKHYGTNNSDPLDPRFGADRCGIFSNGHTST